nr:ABC transporter ATP-binding protein [Micromonospora sp. DSM 115978]
MLVIENLVKTFAGERRRRSNEASRRVRAVDDVSLEVKEGEMFTLLGPSGCGKTTTLRSVAGLERPDSGQIRVADRVLFSTGTGRPFHMPTNQRSLGMVFQSYAIWPHMKVFDNVAFPLQVMKRGTRPGREAIRTKVMAVLETMELDSMANRQATKLSGGQQQRLALARALVTEPALLLLDEPLSNLDAKLRDSLRFELKRLQRELGVTSVYVTHDQIEALALSSRIAVMRDGKIVQIGTPREIYEKPSNRFVAEFIGTSNFIAGTTTGRIDGMLAVRTEHGTMLVDAPSPAGQDQEVLLAVRPEGIDVTVGAAPGGRANEWTGEVVTRSFLGDAVDHIVRLGSTELRVRAKATTSIPPQTEVTLRIDPANLALIPIA